MNQLNQNTTDLSNPPWRQGGARAVHLTAKEQEIMRWAARGKSTWEISRIQDRSEAAVNFHLCNIRRKFGVGSLKAALVMAIDQGVIASH